MSTWENQIVTKEILRNCIDVMQTEYMVLCNMEKRSEDTDRIVIFECLSLAVSMIIRYSVHSFCQVAHSSSIFAPKKV